MKIIKKHLSRIFLPKQLRTTPKFSISVMQTQKKVWLGMLVVALLFAGLAVAAPTEKPTDARLWTSLTGHKITAEFVGIRGEDLVLKGEDGKEIFIRLPMLTATDQALAKNLEEQRTKGEAQTKGVSSNLLPIFVAGPAKGSHAVYTHKNFTAKVSNTGRIDIQCLEDGKPVGKPLLFYFHFDYYKGSTRYYRAVTEFTKFPAPTLSPTLLEYEITVEDGVTAGVTYAFIENTIQIGGWKIDPPKIKEATDLRLDVYFNPSHTFAPETLVVEQKKILEPYTLIISEKNKGNSRFPYGNAVPRLPSPAQRLTVDGPIFGKRNVSLSLKSQSKIWIWLWIYPDYAPYQGYTVGLGKENQASKSDAERLIITID